MLGGMQDFELRVPRLIDHAEREHGHREIVTHWADGRETRSSWSAVSRDARRLAQALEAMGIKPGDRVAVRFRQRGVERDAVLRLAVNPAFEVVRSETAGVAVTPAQMAFREGWLGK